MIQDIEPEKLNNAYRNIRPAADDTMLVFDDEGNLYAKITDQKLDFATYSEVPDEDAVYLFSVSDRRYFLGSINERIRYPEGYEPYPLRQIRDSGSGSELFAAFTGYHLWKWYSSNRYCGVCSEKLVHDDSERALRCRKCGNIIYPRINPAVIVGVINSESILITRYKSGYAHNALIAGFTEIGETLEECVAREVYEEAGIKVKNIRYYKSQPWGIASDLLAGFFCEVDGDDTIRMDDNELKSAQWVKRNDIELQPNNLSLTNEMMYLFKTGRENEAQR